MIRSRLHSLLATVAALQVCFCGVAVGDSDLFDPLDLLTFEARSFRISVETGHYPAAEFPYSGLQGDLWALSVGSTLSTRDGQAVFGVSGPLRRILTVEDTGLAGALGQDRLKPPARFQERRGVTGDFTISWLFRTPPNSQGLTQAGLLFGFTMPNANTASGIGLDEGSYHGRLLLAQRHFGATFGAQLGLSIMPNPDPIRGDDDFYTFGVGAQTQIAPRFKLAGRMSGALATADGSGDGRVDSLNMSLSLDYRPEDWSIELTLVEYLRDPSPAYGVSFRASRSWRLWRN